jgi:cytoskeleton protein RodZ
MARKPKKSETTDTADQDVTYQVGTTDSGELQTTDEAVYSTESNEVIQTSISLCGGTLAAERASQGLTVQDIAKRLRLGVKQVEAIEQDDFTALPEPTIVKGFIRNYAKLLKMPSESLIAAYMELKPEKEKQAFAVHSGINMKIAEGKQSDKTRYFVFTLLLLIATAMWFFYQNFVQKPNPINPIPEIVEALPEFALPVSERDEDAESKTLEMPDQTSDESSAGSEAISPVAELSEPLESNVEPMLTAENATTEATAEDLSNNPNESVDELVNAAETEVADEPSLGKTRLEFNATQETWLSVVNTSGKEVYNKILYAGNHEVVDVWQPAEIVVGNAHGATLTVNGKSIDLAPYTRVNVARVRLNR